MVAARRILCYTIAVALTLPASATEGAIAASPPRSSPAAPGGLKPAAVTHDRSPEDRGEMRRALRRLGRAQKPSFSARSDLDSFTITSDQSSGCRWTWRGFSPMFQVGSTRHIDSVFDCAAFTFVLARGANKYRYDPIRREWVYWTWGCYFGC
jgi:hypothetical protein